MPEFYKTFDAPVGRLVSENIIKYTERVCSFQGRNKIRCSHNDHLIYDTRLWMQFSYFQRLPDAVGDVAVYLCQRRVGIRGYDWFSRVTSHLYL